MPFALVFPQPDTGFAHFALGRNGIFAPLGMAGGSVGADAGRPRASQGDARATRGCGRSSGWASRT